MAHEIRAFQIFYDAQTRSMLDPEFEPLDNSGNERPDWFEYWPIRKYLQAHPLREGSLYGFLSPNFRAKTLLSGAQVRDFVAKAGEADVVTFSPIPCHAACFLNVFEQAEFTQPGFMQVTSAYLRRIGSGVSPETMVNHSGDTVFSNFFLAAPRFWRRWAEAADRLFRMAEDSASGVYEPLNRETPYMRDDGLAKRAQMKVFLMERLVTLLLATSRDFRIVNYPPFELPLSPYFAGLRAEVVRLDALKIALAQTGDPALLREYRALQAKALAAAQQALTGR
jgi:hypothetical protein